MKAIVIDTPGGNKGSISSWLKRGGLEVEVSYSPDIFDKSKIVIFPGNGVFSKTMEWLRFNSLENSFIKFLKDPNKIYIGICIGMQILYETGFEGKKTKGLGILRGDVVKLNRTRIGWEKVKYYDDKFNLEEDFFFMHSFGIKDIKNNLVNIRSFSGNYLFQFHPEKSGKTGDNLLSSLLFNKIITN